MSKLSFLVSVLVIGLMSAILSVRSRADESAGDWNPKAAAAYLDSRQTWWQTWPSAQRDHETFCISCHTALPYALARSALRAPLHETGVTEPERKLVENVSKRVRMWREV